MTVRLRADTTYSRRHVLRHDARLTRRLQTRRLPDTTPLDTMPVKHPHRTYAPDMTLATLRWPCGKVVVTDGDSRLAAIDVPLPARAPARNARGLIRRRLRARACPAV